MCLSPERILRGIDHGFPSFQAIPGSLAAPDRVCPETGHGFPSFQAITGSSASLERTSRRADHGFRCKSTTNQYIEHRRKVLALLVNHSDRLSSEDMSSSCDNLRFVEPAHKSHLNNSITNHRSSIPVFLGSEMMRTSSSKAANTLAGALRPWGRFKAPVQPRWARSEAPGGAEVRRSTDRLTCEIADQGQKRPISTVMRKTEPNDVP
jgi:hypothetical protein